MLKILLLYKKNKRRILKTEFQAGEKNRNDGEKRRRNIQKLSMCLNAGCEYLFNKSFQQIVTRILRKAFFGHALERQNKEVQVIVKRYYLLYIERFVRQDQRFKAKWVFALRFSACKSTRNSGS